MSGETITRYKGRFIKKKVADKIKKSVQLMKEGKQRKSERYVCEGTRLVNLTELGKNLKCSNCHEVLSLENITDEIREGLHSTLQIGCHKCGSKNTVCTGRKNSTRNLS